MVGFFKMPVNLFPDSERPQIAVVTVWPGASADDVNADVSRVIEKELKTIETGAARDLHLQRRGLGGHGGVRVPEGPRLGGHGRLQLAEQDPSAPAAGHPAVPGLQGLVGDAGRAGPLPGAHRRARTSTSPWSASSPTTPSRSACCACRDVANVEVFGGYQPVVRVTLDPDKLQAYHAEPGPGGVGARARGIATRPRGCSSPSRTHILLKNQGELTPSGRGRRRGGERQRPARPVYLRDVATVERGIQERLSAFHGNGKPAIGINIQRALSGHALPTIQAVHGQSPRARAPVSGHPLRGGGHAGRSSSARASPTWWTPCATPSS